MRRYEMVSAFASLNSRTADRAMNRAATASYTRLEDGRYRVRLEVEARKLRSDGRGVEAEAPLDDWIDVGVFGAGERTLYLGKHHLTEAVVCMHKPHTRGKNVPVVRVQLSHTSGRTARLDRVGTNGNIEPSLRNAHGFLRNGIPTRIPVADLCETSLSTGGKDGTDRSSDS